jgi:glycine cleavage system H protein
VGGEVIEVNAALESDPAAVNRDAFGAGWLYKVKLGDAAERDKLLSPSAYEALVAEAAP